MRKWVLTAIIICVIVIASFVWTNQQRSTHPAIPATPIHNTQTYITIPTARISQAQAIQVVENDLKSRFKDAGIGRIVYNDRYIPFSEFQAKNKELPLVYVHPNGTLIPLINGTHTFRGACNNV